MATRFIDSAYYRILAEDLGGLADPVAALAAHSAEVQAFLRGLPEAKRGFAYAPGKWTLGEVVGHLADAQMVFLGRILFLARGHVGGLPGFDENLWVEASGHRRMALADLRELHARGAALVEALVRGLSAADLAREGVANGLLITPAELISYIVAHERHHLKVIRERYL
jgi:uncharacterized damage-inducible protein DinB